MSNFNFIAPVYDGLVRLVFGKKLWEAQQYHLSKIEPGDSVLIIGGGTGRGLEWISGCQIDFLEKSAAMIKQARKRGEPTFIQEDFLSWQPTKRYDWVICPFFLDCFEPEDLQVTIQKIDSFLSPKGKLIVTDFEAQSKTQSVLASLMVLFFRVTAKLPAKKLYDLRPELNSKFKSLEHNSFLNGFVFSDLYSRAEK